MPILSKTTSNQPTGPVPELDFDRTAAEKEVQAAQDTAKAEAAANQAAADAQAAAALGSYSISINLLLIDDP